MSSYSLQAQMILRVRTYEKLLHKRSLYFLGSTVFVLFSVPLLNVRIGTVPIYILDILAFSTWLNAKRLLNVRRYPMQGYVIFIMIAMLVSELVSGIRLGTLLEPIYIIARTLLAFSLFYSTPRIIQSRDDLEKILKLSLAGAAVSATLMVMSSLPPTQAIVANTVFSLPNLVPSSSNIIENFGATDVALRGRSLIGVSILSGAFLNTIWPLTLILRNREGLKKSWRLLLSGAAILIPAAVMLSYSRGAIFGLVLIVVITLALNSRRVRQPVVIGIGIAILFFSVIGWNSEYLKFEWLQAKTEYQLENPYTSRDTTQRLFAYSEPFKHLASNPIFLLVGEGFARDKVSGNTLTAGQQAAVHAVFAAAYYGYGMPAAITYIILLLAAFWLTWKYSWGGISNYNRQFSRALLASLFGLASWFILGHAAVSEPRGAMFLFFIFGLVVVQTRIWVPDSQATHREEASSRI